MAYKVTAPLVITKKQDGSDLYLYAGAVLPDHLSDDEVKRLVDGEFVEKLAVAEESKDSSGKAAAKSSKPSAPSN